jgi:repressor LexA
MAPTKKQRQVFEALIFLMKKGERPTVREIGALVGLRSPATVMKHLRALEKEGLIALSGKTRGIHVTSAALDDDFGEAPSMARVESEIPSGIPLVGRIAAGRPIEAVSFEGAEGKISIDPQVFSGSVFSGSVFSGSGELMALRVAGDSMIEAGILDGDYVIIRRQPVVEEGEIAAVEVAGEVTLKRWHSVGGNFNSQVNSQANSQVRLIAENARFPPIEITAADHKEVRVLGRYVGLLRGELRFA